MARTRSKTPARKNKKKQDEDEEESEDSSSNSSSSSTTSNVNNGSDNNESLLCSLQTTLDRTNTLLSSLLEKQEHADEVASLRSLSESEPAVDLKQRPPSKHGPDAPTVVYVSVCITDLPEVDSAASTFEADFYVILDWEDSRIPVADGIELGEVWNPGVRIINAKAVELGYTDSDRAMAFSLTAPGKIHYEQRYTGTLTTSMLLHRFPFDQQVLNIILEPAFCMADEVQLVLNPGGDIDWNQAPHTNQSYKKVSNVNDFIDNSLQLSEWNLVREKGDESHINVAACRAVFDQIDINQDGVVQASELIESVKRGIQIPKGLNETWDELFARIDVGESGSLEWDEFKKAVTSDVRVVAIEKVNHYLSDDTRWSRISLRMAVIRQWKYYGGAFFLSYSLFSLLQLLLVFYFYFSSLIFAELLFSYSCFFFSLVFTSLLFSFLLSRSQSKFVQF
jgi:hypothetical protein